MTHRDRFNWSAYSHADLLINASEAFPRLEDLVFDAEEDVLLAFRVFDAETELRSKHKTEHMQTWADLLAYKAKQGVTVRLLLSDFEPILTPKLHQKSWKSVYTFLKKWNGEGRFEVICAQHSAQFAPLPRAFFWPWFIKKLWAIKKDIRTGALQPKFAPGLRAHYSLAGKLKVESLFKPTEMRPVTYHQKLAIIDGSKAIVGGLDVDERRYDSASHDRPARETWHDLSVFVDGTTADDLKAHFVSCWNDALPKTGHRQNLEQLCEDSTLVKATAKAMKPPTNHGQPPGVSPKARVIRTVSQNTPGLLAIKPSNTHDEIFQETLDIIAACEHTLYIETQFFRSLDLAHALARRAAQQPELTVIILLPFAPEEVAFDKHRHPAHRHGEWLQGKCLKILRRAFGERLGLFSLAKPEAASAETGRAREYGAGVIHLHSKLLIADERRMTITSANLNDRSLKWDTEVGLSFDDPALALSSRNRLWRQHFNTDAVSSWQPEEALSFWKEIAFANVNRDPHDRQGFILPHRSSKTIRYGRGSLFIPDEMV